MSLLTAQTPDQTGTPAPTRTRLRTRLIAAGAAITLVAAAVGGTVVALTKTVALTVDGQTSSVSTLSGSVAGALESAGYTVGEHDIVVPAVDSAIADGATIALNRARLVTVTIDGDEQQIWTTARTVDQALAELGSDLRGMELSANRSRGIPLDGLALTAETLRSVNLAVGGAAPLAVTSAADTVADLLAARGLTLGAQDTVQPSLTSAVTEGMTVSVTRTVLSTVAQDEPIAQPADVLVEDPELSKGLTEVLVAGRAGVASVRYQVTTVNGAETGRVETGRSVTAEPVASQIKVGTRSTLRWEGTRVFFDDFEFGINWDSLAFCESTNVPTAVNAYPSAGLPTYGLFQFDLPTWQSVDGTGNPVNASPEEQIMRAKLLFHKRGLQPWACRSAA